MGNGLARELQEVKPAEPEVLPTRDVRTGNVPLLGNLIRFETVRRALRVTGLAALDVAGMFLAIWTALGIKTVVQTPDTFWGQYYAAKDLAPLACLVMLLLFARSGLYRAGRSGRASPPSSLRCSRSRS